MKPLIAILLCAFMTVAYADQVYKWVDKNGQVHYSQTPPPKGSGHAKSIDITPQPSNPEGVKAAENLEKQMHEHDQQAAAEQKKTDEEAQKKAQAQQRCNAMKLQLQFYKEAGPVATVDANGNKTYLSDQQHVQKEQQLQDQINQQCH